MDFFYILVGSPKDPSKNNDEILDYFEQLPEAKTTQFRLLSDDLIMNEYDNIRVFEIREKK